MDAASKESARLLELIGVQSEIAAAELDLAGLQFVVERARSLSGASAAVIALPEAGEMVYSAASATARVHLGDRYPLAASLGGLCLRERRVLCSEDCAVDSRVDSEICRRIGARSILCVPLVHREEVLGVLSAYASSPQHFDAGDARALELIGGAIAAHLHHAKRFAREAHRSLHDALTGLPNRRAYEERLPIETARSRRYDRPLALCFLDLDGFKEINDRHGHVVGDKVLQAVAGAIRQARLSDDVFRIGGDEFAVLLPGCSREEAESAIARLLESIDLGPIAALEVNFGVSVGIGDDEPDPTRLHAAADRDLMATKERLYSGHERSHRDVDALS